MEKEAPRVAERFLEAVQSAIELLCRMPGAGAPKILDNPVLSGLRSWPVRGFPALRIYYIHAGDDLRIVRVLHGKRDINPLLEDESDNQE
jgi:toxin ParE1/3/4